jgi:Uma2 family endonuclease
MASTTVSLTLQEYRARYASQTGYEYWFGEVVRKSVPTWLHSILQALLSEVFTRAGYTAGSELELRIDPDWEPRPDVVASLHVEHPYPTRPVDIVAEVLSPDDQLLRVHGKCEHYARIGIARIFVFDPESKKAWEWDRNLENLERISILQLDNGASIHLDTEIWTEMDRRANRP